MAAIAGRYRESDRSEKTRILDEFFAVTANHRKHALRLLRQAGLEPKLEGAGRRTRVYDDAGGSAQITLWETSDRICGKRLKAALPALLQSMDHHEHLSVDSEVRSKLLAMSAATIARVLAPTRRRAKGEGRKRRTNRHALKRQIPVRTFADWGDAEPGFFEADFVVHAGGSMRGSPRADVNQLLRALPLLWRDGEARPTHRTKPKPARTWRTRKDPFASVWNEAVTWLERHPEATARQLFDVPGGAARPFDSLKDLNAQLAIWIADVAHQRIAPGHPDRPLVEALFDEEQGSFCPSPSTPSRRTWLSPYARGSGHTSARNERRIPRARGHERKKTKRRDVSCLVQDDAVGQLSA